MMNSKRNKAVFIVLAVLVVGCGIAVLLMFFGRQTHTAQRVVIEQECVVVYEGLLKDRYGAPVHADGETLHFMGRAGEYTVAFKGGKVCMLSAQCPDQLCVHQGWCDDPRTPIVCLPQQVIISIENVDDYGGDTGLESFTRREFLFDTLIEITVYAPNEDEAQVALIGAFAEFSRIEGITVRYGDDLQAPSDVQRINNSAGIAPQVVDPDIIVMLSRAIKLSELGEGVFDPAIGPLVDLWGIGDSGQGQVPLQQDVKRLLPLIDMGKIQIDEGQHTVFLPEPGMSLDLGGVAKGYATDMAVSALRRCGIEHAFINAGGNAYALGGKPDGSAWRIGIQDPRHAGEILGVVEIYEGSVVTSGDNQRYFIADGVRYHHIFDPDTGYPAQGVWQSTIISSCSMDADILSTMTFILGPEKSRGLLDSLGISGIMVDDKAGIHLYKQGNISFLPELSNGYSMAE